MNVAAGPELAAAVTNAGGLGVIGGLGLVSGREQRDQLPRFSVLPLLKSILHLLRPLLSSKTIYRYTPEMLKVQIDEIKSHLVDKNAPFGVDLLLPQIGGNARAT